MIVGSLFSGIGGFDLGLERAGMRTAWFCEQDKFCQRVLAKHWPGIPCYPDITELAGAAVESVDLLCGGFPCQDISVAGKGAGIDGARSGLWAEYARLIRELRPRYVVVENVPALLGRGLDRVLGDLAALGYDAEWDCLPASAFGAPHRRDRVWLVAYAEGEPVGTGFRTDEPAAERWRRSSDGGSALADADEDGRSEGLQRAAGGRERSGPADLEWSSEHLGDANGQGELGRRPSDAGWWASEPAIRRVVDGLPDRLDRCHALGNALVPQIAEWIGHRIMSYEESR
jgi:DNA (cytosine-5)-methyltransferase 1